MDGAPESCFCGVIAISQRTQVRITEYSIPKLKFCFWSGWFLVMFCKKCWSLIKIKVKSILDDIYQGQEIENLGE
jgi:hypothetical protein